MDHKISRNEFIKFYVGNEINPNFTKIFRYKFYLEAVFQQNKDEFKNIRDRLIEISHISLEFL